MEKKVIDDTLTKKLETLMKELKSLMAERKNRIEELRSEIAEIEYLNESLEKEIQAMLENF